MNDIESEIAGLTANGYEEAASRLAQASFGSEAAAVAYGSVPSPIGMLLAVVTHVGLLAIGFESEDQDEILQRIATKVSPAIVALPSAVGPAKKQLDNYFNEGGAFDLALDRSLITPYQDKVLAATSDIPVGETRSYSEVAAIAGRPKGARATGQALGANPIPIVIPCHRVVAADGSLRGYAGGLELKDFLLNHERGTPALF